LASAERMRFDRDGDSRRTGSWSRGPKVRARCRLEPPPTCRSSRCTMAKPIVKRHFRFAVAGGGVEGGRPFRCRRWRWRRFFRRRCLAYAPRVAALCPILFPTCSTDVALIPHTEKDRVGSKSVDDAAWTKWAGIWTQQVTVRVLVNHGRGRTQPCSLQRLPLPPR
jgi:hypothetical protein